jgi:hypothetical protein
MSLRMAETALSHGQQRAGQLHAGGRVSTHLSFQAIHQLPDPAKSTGARCISVDLQCFFGMISQLTLKANRCERIDPGEVISAAL